MVIGFELRETSEKGERIFATKSFKVGDIVMVGVIEKILNGNHSHASQIGENDYVLHSGMIIKVNHSWGPNCGIKVNKTGDHDFVTMKNISINEEITFDYVMRNYSIDYFPVKCMCGSVKCRGSVTGWKSLSNEKNKEYEGFVAPLITDVMPKGKCCIWK